jgi:hypothetical protein
VHDIAPAPEVFKGVKTAVAFFDKINLRAAYPLDRERLGFLRANSHSVDPITSKYPFGHPGHRYSKLRYTIVCPNQRAQHFIDDLPEDLFKVNYVEPALDFITSDNITPWHILDLFDTQFVHPWHRQQEVRHFDNGGTVTGRRRFWFAWYCDKPSKSTGEPHCFHLEARCQGLPVLRKIQFTKLTTFDHIGFWERRLNLYEVDRERLGRHGTRRRKPLIHRSRGSSFVYNVDRARGCGLFNRGPRTVQALIDNYGRGPFLRKCGSPLRVVNVHTI